MKFEKMTVAQKRARIDACIRSGRDRKLKQYLLQEDFTYSLLSNTGDERPRIINALVAMRGAETADFLMHYYEHYSGARQTIIEHLIQMDTPATIGFVVSLLMAQKVPKKMIAAIYQQLTLSVNKALCTPLSRFFIDDAQSRAALAILLGNGRERVIRGDEWDYHRYAREDEQSFIEHVYTAYETQNRNDQLLLIQALGTIHKTAAVELLVALAAKHPSENSCHRLAIIKALGFSKLDLALDYLVATLEITENYDLKAAVIQAIGMYGDRLPAANLEAHLISPPCVRKAIKEVLCHSGMGAYEAIIRGDQLDFERLLAYNEAYYAPLITKRKKVLRLKLDSANNAIEEAGLLLALGDSIGRSYLIESLGSDNGNMRREAAEMLDSLGEPVYATIFRGEAAKDFERLGTLDFDQYQADIMHIFEKCSSRHRKQVVMAFRQYKRKNTETTFEQSLFPEIEEAQEAKRINDQPVHTDTGYTIEEYNSGYKIYNYSPHTDFYE
jgi:HEAT repeat protein